MKKFKKLIPAFCMLLISAVLMGTSTYAWFSMNKTVTASGMQVTAKSDSVYLLISNTEASTSAAAIQAENEGKGNIKVTETRTGDAVNVYPVALATKAQRVGVKQTSITDYSSLTSWYKSIAATADSSASVEANEVNLAGLTFSDYVVKYTYKLTLAKGSNPAKDVKVDQVVITPNTSSEDGATVKPVCVLVVNRDAQTKTEEFKVEGQTADTVTGKYTIKGTTALADSLTDATVVTFDVYVYYDGNNSAVFTNNKAKLNGVSIDITFSVTPKTAA